ncbi:MAG: hypothetical protein ACRC4L_01045 [Mycoplasma sp.]
MKQQKENIKSDNENCVDIISETFNINILKEGKTKKGLPKMFVENVEIRVETPTKKEFAKSKFIPIEQSTSINDEEMFKDDDLKIVPNYETKINQPPKIVIPIEGKQPEQIPTEDSKQELMIISSNWFIKNGEKEILETSENQIEMEEIIIQEIIVDDPDFKVVEELKNESNETDIKADELIPKNIEIKSVEATHVNDEQYSTIKSLLIKSFSVLDEKERNEILSYTDEMIKNIIDSGIIK